MSKLESILSRLKSKYDDNLEKPILTKGLFGNKIVTKYPRFKEKITITHYAIQGIYNIRLSEDGSVVFDADIHIQKSNNLADIRLQEVYGLLYIKKGKEEEDDLLIDE